MSEPKKIEPKVLIPQMRIEERVTELAQEIMRDFSGKELTAVCVLKSSFVFFSDLIRRMNIPLNCEFLAVSSYGDRTTSSGEVKVTLDLNEPIENKHVLIVEDIVDSGLTLAYLIKSLGSRRPATLKTCALLMKPENIRIDVPIDYVGFKIGPEFVVGYGMDYAGEYRGLPFIGYVEQNH